ncbi:MAG: FtsH protease activity modulator HflK [Chloroflexota bacterium]|nr:MAG: FtsH protease activity modulator HflK [Chloroflexota bacterium]
MSMDDFPGRRRGPDQADVEAQLRQAREQLTSIVRRVAPIAIVAAVGLWLASGVYTIQPGEVGIVRHFGREIARTGPGLHYRLPWPVQRIDAVNVEAIRRAEIGFRTQDGVPKRVATEAHMLTGDENIVDTQLIVQYRVSDPTKYLFRLEDPDEALRAATEVAMRSAAGKSKIDDLLTTGRSDVQEATRIFLQRLLDSYQSGIHVTDVKLQVVDPPEQVKDAFQEVVRAREDRERLINESRAYREDILPKARGQAQQVTREAEGYKEQRRLQANGDVARFVAVLQEYVKSKDVTRERLYIETIERVLVRVDKVVLDGAANGNVLPFLPLRGLQEGVRPAGATQVTQPAPAPAPVAQPAAPAKPGPSAPAKPAPAKP